MEITNEDIFMSVFTTLASWNAFVKIFRRDNKTLINAVCFFLVRTIHKISMAMNRNNMFNFDQLYKPNSHKAPMASNKIVPNWCTNGILFNSKVK